jgi:predicted O-methyltransferase YrrM
MSVLPFGTDCRPSDVDNERNTDGVPRSAPSSSSHYAEAKPRPGCAEAQKEEPVITSAESLAYVEAYVPEDSFLAAARRRGTEVGAVPIGTASGAALQFLASLLGAKQVAEFGTGAGVSGLWLLRGLSSDGVLTSIDREAEHQRLARETFTEAGIAPQRFRLITGSALDVAPRLNSDGYDLVFIDGDKTEYSEYLIEAKRLARPGGVIAFDNALWHDRVADPSQRDPETSAIRNLLRQVADDDDLLPLLLPTGDGLLLAQLAGDAD